MLETEVEPALKLTGRSIEEPRLPEAEPTVIFWLTVGVGEGVGVTVGVGVGVGVEAVAVLND